MRISAEMLLTADGICYNFCENVHKKGIQSEWHIFYVIISMTKEFVQYNTTVADYEDLYPHYLDDFCRLKLADEHFRFATFEGDDYRQGRLTVNLYNYIPGSVFFSVESPFEIESAIDKLIELNPGVQWGWANLNYVDHEESGHARITVELRLSQIPMRVSAHGSLVFK